MQDLLLKNDFRIARVGSADAIRRTDALKVFSELVVRNEGMYPGIAKWLDAKVLPGLKSNERIGFVGYLNGAPSVSAVVKRGARSKICHLRVADSLQDSHLGELFFSLMALEIRGSAKEVHFTLPESLWERKQSFFKAFGFHRVELSGTQYRLFDTELRCSSPFSSFWAAVLEKLPKLAGLFSVGGQSWEHALLMSIRPQHAERVLEGKKKVEIRRRFAPKWTGQKVSLYASRPLGAIVGEAQIGSVVSGKPALIWEQFSTDVGCTKEEFDRYTEGAQGVYAIVLNEVVRYSDRIPVEQLACLLNEELVPPQSYCSIESNRPWSEAASVASLLHSSLRVHFGGEPPPPSDALCASAHSERELSCSATKRERIRPLATLF